MWSHEMLDVGGSPWEVMGCFTLSDFFDIFEIFLRCFLGFGTCSFFVFWVLGEGSLKVS